MGTRKLRAKLFKNGGSQAVRLPREVRFEGTEVLVHKEGSRVILEAVHPSWSKEFVEMFTTKPETPFPERDQPRGFEKRAKLK